MKRIKKNVLFLFFIMLLVPITTVFAADCSDVQNAVNELEELENAYSEKDCDNAVNSITLSECATIQVSKSSVLEKIFKYNDEKTCESIDLSNIIDKYADDCSNEFSSEVKEISDSVMKVFFITAPFILLLFGSLDFFKIIVGASPEEIKKNRSNFVKRLVAFLLLYLAPVMVRTLFSITPYDMNGTNYICAQEISFNPKVSSNRVSGTYGGNNYSSGQGAAIAEAAKEIKEYAVDHGYTWTCTGISAQNVATPYNDSYGGLCCAELIGASLLRSGLYDEAEANHFQTTSAPNAANLLAEAGWIAIWDPEELEPGDVLLYEKYTGLSGCGGAQIEGTYYPVPHIDIYYGDGMKVTTGGDFGHALTTFSTDSFYTQGGYAKWLCGLRYPGK